MYMNNLNLFAVGSFEINSVTVDPITFNHGDKLQFTTTTLVSPTPSGLIELAKSSLKDKNDIKLFSILIYENESGKQNILQTFVTTGDFLTGNATSSPYLYKVETHFEVDTSKLSSRKINNSKGFFRLVITWQVGNENGKIFDSVLPIYEKVR